MEHLWQPRAIVFVLSDGQSQRFHLRQGCLVSLVHSRYGEKGMSEVALGANGSRIHTKSENPCGAVWIGQECSVSVNELASRLQ
eukprot:4862620-Pleurochrysis_carterae.AAC.1